MKRDYSIFKTDAINLVGGDISIQDFANKYSLGVDSSMRMRRLLSEGTFESGMFNKAALAGLLAEAKEIGIKARRYIYANMCLPEDEISKALQDRKQAEEIFAKSFQQFDLLSVAWLASIIADNCNLGLSY